MLNFDDWCVDWICNIHKIKRNDFFKEINSASYQQGIDKANSARDVYQMYQEYLKQQDQEHHEKELSEAVDRLASEIKGISRCGDCTRKHGGYKFTNSSSDTLHINPDELTSEHKSLQPKISLTYAEALGCEKVRVHWPDQSYGRSFEYEKHKPDGAQTYWLKEDLHDFDLAERRNYRMERVD